MTTRVVNIRREPYDVYIGRGRGSILGNPYRITQDCDRECALQRFRVYFARRLKDDPGFKAAVEGLRGKFLGCFCAPAAGFKGRLLCHGQIIAGYLDGVSPESVG